MWNICIRELVRIRNVRENETNTIRIFCWSATRYFFVNSKNEFIVNANWDPRSSYWKLKFHFVTYFIQFENIESKQKVKMNLAKWGWANEQNICLFFSLVFHFDWKDFYEESNSLHEIQINPNDILPSMRTRGIQLNCIRWDLFEVIIGKRFMCNLVYFGLW